MPPKRRPPRETVQDSDFSPHNARKRRRKALPKPARAPLARHLRDPEEYYLGPMVLQCSNCTARHFAKEKKPAHPTVFLDCCDLGRICPDQLSTFSDFPSLLEQFFLNDFGEASEYRHLTANFHDHIRKFNASLAMASMTAQIKSPVGRGPYCFRIHGQIYHTIGALHPQQDEPRRYGQLYILDTDSASSQRQKAPQNIDCNPTLMSKLSQLIAEVNPYARSYYMMGEIEKAEAAAALAENRPTLQVTMRFTNTQLRGLQGRLYDLPTANEVAAIYVGPQDGTVAGIHDLVIHERSEKLTAISPTDRAIDRPCQVLLDVLAIGRTALLQHSVADAKSVARVSWRRG